MSTAAVERGFSMMKLHFGKSDVRRSLRLMLVSAEGPELEAGNAVKSVHHWYTNAGRFGRHLNYERQN